MSFHLPESLELHKLQMKLYSGKVWRWEKHFYSHFYHLVICNCLISFFLSDLPASFWGICSCEQKSRKLSFKHRKPQGCYLRCMDGSAKQQPGHETKSRRVWLLVQPQPCPLPSPSQLTMTYILYREKNFQWERTTRMDFTNSTPLYSKGPTSATFPQGCAADQQEIWLQLWNIISMYLPVRVFKQPWWPKPVAKIPVRQSSHAPCNLCLVHALGEYR